MPVDSRSAHHAPSRLAGAHRDHRADHKAADQEEAEEERFRRWLAASDGVVRAHKDAAGWEEPPRRRLRRFRRKDR